MQSQINFNRKLDKEDYTLKEKDFIRLSLELNLFFGRIMKEHLIFMAITLPIKNSEYILEADTLKKSFEELLMEVLSISKGNLSKESLESDEFVTKYTLDAEKKVEKLYGICIDKELTKSTLELADNETNYSYNLEGYVYDLNSRIINLLMDVIKFKEKVIDEVLKCDLAIFIYPEMLEHILEEAKFYLKLLLDIQEKILSDKDILKREVFWNHIMEEHALFTLGLLDPSEEELIKTAHEFAKTFEELLKKTKEAEEGKACDISKENLKATEDMKDFNISATKGILACEIKSLINPLLADHLLRESNRYIRILKEFLRKC